MKRRWRTFLMFVGLGMLVNVALAWALAISTPSKSLQNREAVYEDFRQNLELSQGRWQLLYSSSSVARGVDLQLTYSRQLEEANTVRREHSWQFGWPLRSVKWHEVRIIEAGERQKLQQTGIPLPELLREMTPEFPSQRRLPVQPIWAGFVLNTIIFAGSLWLILRGPMFVRRAIRRRQNRCAECGYPVGSSVVCTECGKPLHDQTT